MSARLECKAGGCRQRPAKPPLESADIQSARFDKQLINNLGGEALVSMENNARRFLREGSVLFGSAPHGDELLSGAETFLSNVFSVAKTG